jgi:hypothetical protein
LCDALDKLEKIADEIEQAMMAAEAELLSQTRKPGGPGHPLDEPP